jgi:hypothetical protein
MFLQVLAPMAVGDKFNRFCAQVSLGKLKWD